MGGAGLLLPVLAAALLEPKLGFALAIRHVAGDGDAGRVEMTGSE